MDISIRQAQSVNGNNYGAAYISMFNGSEIEGQSHPDETLYVTYVYHRKNGEVIFKDFNIHDASLETFKKVTQWNNERKIKQALVGMTDFIINSNIHV